MEPSPSVDKEIAELFMQCVQDTKLCNDGFLH